VNNENFAEEDRIEVLWKSVMDIGIKEAKETARIENHSNCLNKVVNDKRSSNLKKKDFGLTWD